MLAVTNTLNGTASVTAHNGAISGIKVDQLLRRLERRPLSGTGDFRSRRTPFDQLAINLKIEQGQVSVDEINLSGQPMYLAVGGQVSVPARDLDPQRGRHASSETASEFKPALRGAGPSRTTRSCSPTRRA